MEDKRFLVIIHRFFVDGVVKKGGADYIADYFRQNGYLETLIEHPLEDFSQPSIVYQNGSIVKEQKMNWSIPLRWLWEVWFNLLSSRRFEGKFDFVLAVDPLSCFSAILIKKIGITKKVYFHSIDYSEKRFKNKILNFFYQKLFSFAVNQADLTSFVSLKMGEKIKELNGSQIFYLPNSPDFDRIPRLDPSQKERYSLVYTKTKLNETEIERLVSVVQRLRETYPEVKLTLVGAVSPKAVDIINYSGVKNSIVIHGVVDYHTNLRLISQSSIGLAWYEGNLSFEKYADSLKIREYAAAGLPVISNDGIGTAYEMEKEDAGILVHRDEELIKAIELLFTDERKYQSMRNKGLAWAQRLDKKILLQTLSTRLTNL